MTCLRVEGSVAVERAGDDRPVADRPHAALESGHLYSGLRPDPYTVRRYAGSAKARLFGPGHFSFNVSGGRCEICQGDGTVKVEMQFLADVELICEECKGTRFKSGILEVRYNGLNIHEVAATDGARGARTSSRIRSGW